MAWLRRFCKPRRSHRSTMPPPVVGPPVVSVFASGENATGTPEVRGSPSTRGLVLSVKSRKITVSSSLPIARVSPVGEKNNVQYATAMAS